MFDILAVQGLAGEPGLDQPQPDLPRQRLCLISLAELDLVRAFSVFDF
jgi:hypothetical protein